MKDPYKSEKLHRDSEAYRIQNHLELKTKVKYAILLCRLLSLTGKDSAIDPLN